MRHRIRFPDGRDLDRDMGPGPVGNTRGAYQRSIGAVLLPDAVAPKLAGLNAIYQHVAHGERRRA